MENKKTFIELHGELMQNQMREKTISLLYPEVRTEEKRLELAINKLKRKLKLSLYPEGSNVFISEGDFKLLSKVLASAKSINGNTYLRYGSYKLVKSK